MHETALLVLALMADPAAPPLQTNPMKMATTGRFDISADAAVRSIGDGQVATGSGSVDRMNWIPEAGRPRGYTVNFPISHVAWREFAVRFTPDGDGTVTLALMGPWEEASKGVIFRQEVLWDAVAVQGAELADGGFESASLDAAGWKTSGGSVQVASAALPAVDGRRYARTWHNGTLSTSFGVAGGSPVTIRLYARAAMPPDFKEMRRISDRNTPVHQAAKRFMRGTNLGNYLDAPPGQDWGASYSAADFVHVRAEGFDHVRLPIAWHHHAGPGPKFQLSDEIFTKADFLVNHAIRQKLSVIVNVHNYDAFTSDPAGQKDKFLAIWRQVAAHYAKSPPSVAFELLNEPKDAATTEAINPIYAEAIGVIRRTNPQRTIFVGPGKFNQASELPQLRLPDDDLKLIVTVHCYDPFYFTHQGAFWTSADVKPLKGIRFPGPPETPLEPPPGASERVRDWIHRYNTLPAETNPSSPQAFRGAIQQAKEWGDYYGRPVHFGEFGAYQMADAASRARFYCEFRAALDEAGIGWAAWDWKAGFKYWDDKTGQPAPGLREALFPNASSK